MADGEAEPTEASAALEALYERARRATHESRRQSDRAAELVAFVRALRKEAHAEPLVCAWCSRISTEGYWLEAQAYMAIPVPTSFVGRASHGICPECFARVSAAAEEARRAET
jgi:hypothetical protein